ncbi:YhjD/YihY/BrkB family envelope integrity protein [Xylophilus sp.]|uniref:YhjD/YihY/BrkB family envelope integrity protein n=1 Tax=Xylophilus sp. TaxID=2653893 RepID=UPI0013B883BA|nr:YhjD/YihY/BrkB family envelope integrity protein [Xylophilus sp.]KAF1048546.1 MAG: dTDP-fucosamine acetyltransferase [Xylophilus sp.]
MIRPGAAWSRFSTAALATPGLGVLLLAIRNYVLHQSANQAGSLAFSSVLAMFPLLILLSSAAGYIGQPGDAADLAGRVLEYAPPVVRQAMQPVVAQVLAQRNQALLALGVVVTLWTASSGMQAVRTALNRAYGIGRGLPFWRARIKVTLFTLVVGVGVVATFGSVVVMPYVWRMLEDNVGAAQGIAWLHDGVRYGAAFVALSVLYALLYGWLPDIRQRLYTVLPGALAGAALWVGAAATLSYTLRSAGKLALVYGSFAGVVATLVFLYVSATTLIYGAEVNAVLREKLAPVPQPQRPVLTVRIDRVDDLDGHATVPSRFSTDTVLDVQADGARFALARRQLPALFHKDYDAHERPQRWPRQFDTAHWALLSAWQGAQRVGGLVAARDTPGADLLVVWDLRVDPASRREGVGAALFRAAEDWGRRHGCTELKVETQNVNPGACAFYQRLGCTLAQAVPGAYPDLPDEVQLIWRKPLVPVPEAAPAREVTPGV